MNLSVGAKFGFWLSLLGILAIGTTGYYAYAETRAMLVEAAKQRLVTATGVLGQHFTVALDEVARDVGLLARLEEVESLANGELDVEPYRLRLANVFANTLDVHPEYQQLRLIGASDFGRELVRVDRTDTGTTRVTGGSLQEKRHYPYVYETLARPRGAFYLSEIDLNREQGVSSGLDKPTIRLATPVYARASGTVFGILVVNVGLDTLFENLRTHLILTRDEHRLLFMNTSAERLLRRGDGQSVLHLLDDGLSREEAATACDRLTRTGAVENAEHRFRLDEESEFWGLLSMIEIEYRKHAAILISVVDITRRKNFEMELDRYRDRLESLVEERTAALREARREALRNERLAAIGQLTGTASHELRNPLGTIQSSFVVLSKLVESPNPRVVQALARIDRSIARCDNIIGELLDYTRTRELHREPTEVDRWLDQVLGEQELPQGVALHESLASAARLLIDRQRLGQAVVNLVQNAYQAMVEADPPVERPSSRVHSCATPDRVEIVIADNGPGMDERTRARVFEPLFSTRAFGVGLGLPLVKQVLDLHGGEIEIDSAPGAGTRVKISLPVARSPVPSTVTVPR